MAEERMLNDEILLGLIKANSGGGGGTDDYNDLKNQPKIEGVTLTGNKTASDLGLASASALANKVDKVAGKDLSSNDYSDSEKQKNADNATAISAIKDGATIDSFADVETALSGKQDTLTFDDVPTDNSNNPVKSNGVYDALASKQNATDNNLTTEAKTIVGAINEHEGDIGSLKSGLTNVDVSLSVPKGTGKNLIPLTLDNLKSLNSTGTWSDNVYTNGGLTYTVNTDSTGIVTSIVVTGSNTGESSINFVLITNSTANIINLLNNKSLICNGCPANGEQGTYNIYGWRITKTGTSIRDTGEGIAFEGVNSASWNLVIAIGAGYTIPSGGLTFYPMIRLASITDPTFAPYIPSVESRLNNIGTRVVQLTGVTTDTIGRAILTNVYNGLYKVKVEYSGSLVFGFIRPTSNGNTVVMCVDNNLQPLTEKEVNIDLYYLV